mmetsp:Transcript_158737/g.505341  ORF Transcript_158737/g.505341 Transcript_158737/m.505341 type:complete len:311 (+) Transcript_158737:1012-1944(+)
MHWYVPRCETSGEHCRFLSSTSHVLIASKYSATMRSVGEAKFITYLPVAFSATKKSKTAKCSSAGFRAWGTVPMQLSGASNSSKSSTPPAGTPATTTSSSSPPSSAWASPAPAPPRGPEARQRPPASSNRLVASTSKSCAPRACNQRHTVMATDELRRKSSATAEATDIRELGWAQQDAICKANLSCVAVRRRRASTHSTCSRQVKDRMPDIGNSHSLSSPCEKGLPIGLPLSSMFKNASSKGGAFGKSFQRCKRKDSSALENGSARSTTRLPEGSARQSGGSSCAAPEFSTQPSSKTKPKRPAPSPKVA